MDTTHYDKRQGNLHRLPPVRRTQPSTSGTTVERSHPGTQELPVRFQHLQSGATLPNIRRCVPSRSRSRIRTPVKSSQHVRLSIRNYPQVRSPIRNYPQENIQDVSDKFSNVPDDVLSEITMRSDIETLINLSFTSLTFNEFLSRSSTLKLLEKIHNLPHSTSLGQLVWYSKLSFKELINVVAKNNDVEFISKILAPYYHDKDLVKTALDSSATAGSYDVVKLLLSTAVKMLTIAAFEIGNFTTCLVDSAIIGASRNGYSTIVGMLLEHPHDNDTLSNAFKVAASSGHSNVLDVLQGYEYGLVDDNQYVYYEPVINGAVEYGHFKIADKLLKLYADRSDPDVITDFIEGSAIDFTEDGNLEAVKYYVNKGAGRGSNQYGNEYSSDIPHYNYEPLISTAIDTGHADIVYFLVNLTTCNVYNQTMLYAAGMGDIGIVKTMLALGADNFNESLSAAFSMLHTDIVDILVDAGASNLDEELDKVIARKRLSSYRNVIHTGVRNSRSPVGYSNIEQLPRFPPSRR